MSETKSKEDCAKILVLDRRYGCIEHSIIEAFFFKICLQEISNSVTWLKSLGIDGLVHYGRNVDGQFLGFYTQGFRVYDTL